MSSVRPRGALCVALIALMTLGGCGGGSNPAAPAPVPTPRPAPTPVTSTVAQGSFTGLEPSVVLPVLFTTANLGDLEAIVDWTFATNDLDVLLVRGNDPCRGANDRFDLSLCTVIAAETGTTTKPERLRVRGLAAGTYTLYIGNIGPTRESLSFQILLTFTPAAGAPGTALSAAGGPGGVLISRPLRGVVPK